MTAACIGEPISWLRLETQAAGLRDAAVAAHLAACAGCRSCLDEIERDVVALRPLPVAAPRPSRARWWMWTIPALAAAALVIVVVRPREHHHANITTVKGVGEVVLGVVRARDGVIRTDATTFAPGDRWKVVVTCPPDEGAWIDVAVVEAGARTADYPVAPARIACGNQVPVPGAFELTGTRPDRVCVRVAAGPDGAARRALPVPGEDGVACVVIDPE